MVAARSPRPSRRKRTNVRFYRWAEGLIRLALRVATAVSPALAARLAERLFFTPQRWSPRPEAVFASAAASTITVRSREVRVWRWGTTGPVVLLVHGWGGRASQFRSFVEAILGRGYSVVAFDAPGHGASGHGRSSMVEFAEAMSEIARVHGPLAGVVGHSLGGAAAALALSRGLQASRTVLIGSPTGPARFTEMFVRRLGLEPRVMAILRANVESRLGIRWDDLSLERFLPRLRGLALVVHDRDDREVPWSEGQEIANAWPGAQLVTTRGLGHRRILDDPGVVARVVAFLTGRAVLLPAPGRRDPLHDAESLERALWDRDGGRRGELAARPA